MIENGDVLVGERTNMTVDTEAGPMQVGISTVGNMSPDEKVALVQNVVQGILEGDFEDITDAVE